MKVKLYQADVIYSPKSKAKILVMLEIKYKICF